MMMQKLSALACAVVVTCTATMGFAQTSIGDFDDGTTSGWAANSGSVIITSTNYDSAVHATTGTNALNLFLSPSAGFQWAIQLDNNDVAGLPALIAANPILVADISWRTDEWTIDPDGAWARWDQVAVNSAAGWKQTSDADMIDPANPGFPGSWDPNNWGATHQRTLTWDLRGPFGGDFSALAASPWAQLYMSVNFDGNFNTAPGYSFWIDSIRLMPVPEPASLALFGICGMCTLLRRR
jgi:hypothetical protein